MLLIFTAGFTYVCQLVISDKLIIRKLSRLSEIVLFVRAQEITQNYSFGDLRFEFKGV